MSWYFSFTKKKKIIWLNWRWKLTDTEMFWSLIQKIRRDQHHKGQNLQPHSEAADEIWMDQTAGEWAAAPGTQSRCYCSSDGETFWPGVLLWVIWNLKVIITAGHRGIYWERSCGAKHKVCWIYWYYWIALSNSLTLSYFRLFLLWYQVYLDWF